MEDSRPLSGTLPKAHVTSPVCLPSIPAFEHYAHAVVSTIRLEPSPYREAGGEQLEKDYVRYLESKVAPFVGSDATPLGRGAETILDDACRYFGERYGSLMGEPPPTVFGPLTSNGPIPGERLDPDTLASAMPQCRTFRLGSFRAGDLATLDGGMLVVHELAHLLSPVIMRQDGLRPEHFEKTRMGWCVGEPRDMANLPACRYYRAVDEACAEIDALVYAENKGHSPRVEYYHMEITLDRRREDERDLAATVREMTSGPDSLVADIRRSVRDRAVGAINGALEAGLRLLGFVPGPQETIEFPALYTNIPGCKGSSRGVLVHSLDRLIAEHSGKEAIAEARDALCRARFLPKHADAEAVLGQYVGEESGAFLKYAKHHALIFLYAQASQLPPGRCRELRGRLTRYVVGRDGRGGDI